ncbi:MAG: class I SAM-dependent methyltransferase [Candidatus Methanoperedens sp.]|nr:class I SAM-dependent methyltransferase [Candidatus Methanoperedens sp.]
MADGMVVKSVEIFDRNWKKYEVWFEKNEATYSSELKALKKVIPEGLGLEIGVGSGRFAQPLGAEIGIDLSRNMLKLAKERGIQVIQGVGENLPFKDNTFDFVLIVVTLCFVENPVNVLSEAHRVLKRGGRLIVAEINKDSQLGRLYEAKKEKSEFYKISTFYSGNEIIGMFDEVGIRYLESYQTLLQPLAFPEMQEEPVKGYDGGGFVVIVGNKKIFSIDARGNPKRGTSK